MGHAEAQGGGPVGGARVVHREPTVEQQRWVEEIVEDNEKEIKKVKKEKLIKQKKVKEPIEPATAGWPWCAARCRGRKPYTLAAAGSAPTASRSATVEQWPWQHASWRGVSPSASAALGSAPRANRSATTASCPADAARYIGVPPPQLRLGSAVLGHRHYRSKESQNRPQTSYSPRHVGAKLQETLD